MRLPLPGFRDLYPEDCAQRLHIAAAFRKIMGRFAFEEYDGPVLEPLELFEDKSGPEVAEQLFRFEDRGGRPVALRPEMTPTLARMVGARCQSLRKPIRWCAVGEQFRYERPQKGRLRSFLQLNGDILGESEFRADGELIASLLSTFLELGLGPDHIALRLSDRLLWGILLEQFPGIDGEGVLRAIDRSAKESPEAIGEALRAALGVASDKFIAAWSRLSECKSMDALRKFFSPFPKAAVRLTQWSGLLEFLGAMGLGGFVTIDLSVVRGLAYYTGFVFEIFERNGAGRALAGGGRYDDLVEKLGGPSLPACGFAIGDVVLSNVLAEKNLFGGGSATLDLWVAFGEGEQANGGLAMAAAARAAGFSVSYDLRSHVAIDRQLRQAARSGARFALIDNLSGGWRIKNLSTGEAIGCDEKNFISIWFAICKKSELAIGGDRKF